MSALDRQEGGGHYKDLVIQPVEFCHKNGLGFCESSVIKYVTRWRNKNGIQDLKKAKHFIDLLIEMESPSESDEMLKKQMEAQAQLANLQVELSERQRKIASGEPWVDENGTTVRGNPDKQHLWLDHGEWLWSCCGVTEDSAHSSHCPCGGETSA